MYGRRIDPSSDTQAEPRPPSAAETRAPDASADLPLFGAVAAATGARRIVEVGSGLATAALWLAHGSPLALVDTVELDPAHVRLARENHAARNFGGRVLIHDGHAGAVLDSLDAGAYDLAYFDGTEPTWTLVAALRRLLRPGGVLIAGSLILAPSAAVAELGDPERWVTHGFGETAIAVKLGD